MSEARPSTPSEQTIRALAEADASPGHWVPFLKRKARSLQSYYKGRYPGYQFSFRKGTLYVMREER